jgi:leucyl-tRNA---protein transferase
MESLFRYVAAPSRCGYLPDQNWSLEYEYVAEMTAAEYQQRMLEGWRRFGTMLFRPACSSCTACQALRVAVGDFREDRSQRRARKANEGSLILRIGPPGVSRVKLQLYDRYHAFQTAEKGWPQHPAKDAGSYCDSFVRQPFDVEEWCYYLDQKLVGVGYVDPLLPVPQAPAGNTDVPPGAASHRRDACATTAAATNRSEGRKVGLALVNGEPMSGGLSAIYFFYDPDLRGRSPGTWNVLCLIDEARRRGLPYVYLGYYVPGCPSMEYKPRFRPNEIRSSDGRWHLFSGLKS